MISAKLNQSDVNAFMGDLNKFAQNIKLSTNSTLSNVGEKTYDLIRNNIGTHSPMGANVYGVEWRALTPEWLEAKTLEGSTKEIWAQWGGIGAAVEWVQTFNPPRVFVGIDGDKYPVDYAKSMRNEFSYHRPVFTTIGNKVAADMEKGIGTINDKFMRIIIDAVARTWGI